MVHAPSRFTFAAHEVRRLRSRSVAVIVKRSFAASKRKFERMGIVVLRSTTPCVAVSSLSSSNLLTLMSIAVPWIAPVASTAIMLHLVRPRTEQPAANAAPAGRTREVTCYYCYLLYQIENL